VLLNLIINAIEAMSEIGQRDGINDCVRYRRAGRRAVEVRDTGPGLDLNAQLSCLSPFTRPRPGGLALVVNQPFDRRSAWRAINGWRERTARSRVLHSGTGPRADALAARNWRS